MQVLGVPGVKLSGMIFDAGPGELTGPAAGGRPAGGHGRAAPPIPSLLQDVFFRIGGATAGSGDRQPGGQQLRCHPRRHLGLARRPRRGRGLDQQHRRHRPHRQRQQRDRLRPVRRALPEERGDLERPGRRRTSSSRTRCPTTRPARRRGWPAPAPTATRRSWSRPRSRSFSGYGMGSYCFFNQGVPIESATAFSVPDRPGVQLQRRAHPVPEWLGQHRSCRQRRRRAGHRSQPGPDLPR